MSGPQRRVLVTGGASGIGAAICKRLAADQLDVTFCDLNVDAGRALAQKIGGTFADLDATDYEGVAAFVGAQAPFDILVNNIGVDQHSFFTDTGPEDWRHLFAVNLETTFAFTKAVLPAMQTARFGRIVNISSEAGRLGSKGGSVYASAKAGMLGFTRSIARENARFGITANAVVPGPIRTPLVDKAIAEHGERLQSNMESLTLLGRLGEPGEVAAAVAFLASDEASFVTGEVLGVSGGMGCGA